MVDGSRFNHTLEGNSDDSTFWGDAGNDLLKGRGNTDNLMGGAGDDDLLGGTHGDRLDGGEGFDVADYSEATGRVIVDRANIARNTGEAAGDSYVSIEGVRGSSFNDEFYGAAGWDGFYAGAGDDVLEGRGGGDHLNGGDGFDYAVYWSAGTAVRASLLNPSGNSGDAAGDEYVSIEGLQGNHQANSFYGWGGSDLLFGEGGNDYVEGGDGADTISGGDGLDWLLGNAGADVFRFDTGLSTSNVDTLAEFSVAQGDRIALATNVFSAFSAVVAEDGAVYNNTLESSAFVVGTRAGTSAHKIVYDQATGALYYDADGTGAMAQVQFAKVRAGTALTAAHFQLFTL